MVKGNGKKSFVLLIFSIMILILGVYLYKVFYANSAIDMQSTPAEIQISSEKLISSFMTDEDLANSKYVQKTLEVKGIVREITFKNDRYTVFLQGGNEFCIICDMQADQIENIRGIEPGQEVFLKGVCKGFLMDAILLNCILLNKS